MLKIILYLILALVAFLFLANAKIQFSPFKVELQNWKYAVGFFLILIGIAFIRIDAEQKSKKEGVNYAIDYLRKSVDGIKTK
ncbi:MAG: hypothetical protein WBL21_06985 [Salinimicrobium sp.]